MEWWARPGVMARPVPPLRRAGRSSPRSRPSVRRRARRHPARRHQPSARRGQAAGAGTAQQGDRDWQNYAEHAREMGGEPPAEPVLFLKPSTAVCGPADAIQYPALTQRLDYEGELAVVIGRLCREVPPEQAAEVIFGYTCANDVTARRPAASGTASGRGRRGSTRSARWGRGSRPTPTPSTWSWSPRSTVRCASGPRTSQLLPRRGGAGRAYASNVMTLLPGDVLLDRDAGGDGGPLLQDGDEVSVTIDERSAR